MTTSASKICGIEVWELGLDAGSLTWRELGLSFVIFRMYSPVEVNPN